MEYISSNNPLQEFPYYKLTLYSFESCESSTLPSLSLLSFKISLEGEIRGLILSECFTDTRSKVCQSVLRITGSLSPSTPPRLSFIAEGEGSPPLRFDGEIIGTSIAGKIHEKCFFSISAEFNLFKGYMEIKKEKQALELFLAYGNGRSARIEGIWEKGAVSGNELAANANFELWYWGKSKLDKATFVGKVRFLPGMRKSIQGKWNIKNFGIGNFLIEGDCSLIIPSSKIKWPNSLKHLICSPKHEEIIVEKSQKINPKIPTIEDVIIESKQKYSFEEKYKNDSPKEISIKSQSFTVPQSSKIEINGSKDTASLPKSRLITTGKTILSKTSQVETHIHQESSTYDENYIERQRVFLAPEKKKKKIPMRRFLEDIDPSSYNYFNQSKLTDFDLQKVDESDRQHIDSILRKANQQNKTISSKQVSVLFNNIKELNDQIYFVERVGPYIDEIDPSSLVLMLSCIKEYDLRLQILTILLPYFGTLNNTFRELVLQQFIGRYLDDAKELVSKE